MSKDSLGPLNAAGLQRLPEPMRAVFEDLSPEELRVASAIQERLNAVAPDVEGQISDPNNNNCLC
ncbi:aroma-sacti cluster domain-containing protein [Actinoallomurus soli]|uniref:aroma-sacti cluster domain-containing protein n=1 Tax=Actinoallomurus soli TaxID=2952535 RepID=UPI002091F8E9|nr:aroma-sacti cluster domain-containing protein [Actinoallomurus soli]MCO5973218.1 hypothetical protein [Actinoallomurus soli]